MLISAKQSIARYIKLRGDLDHYKASDLKKSTQQICRYAQNQKNGLDMKGMDFMDKSQSVGLIMGFIKKLKNKNKQLYF